MAEQELQVILLFRPPSPLSLARPLAPSPSRKGGIRGGAPHMGPELGGGRAARSPSRIVAMGSHRAESGGLGRPQVTFSQGAEFFH